MLISKGDFMKEMNEKRLFKLDIDITGTIYHSLN